MDSTGIRMHKGKNSEKTAKNKIFATFLFGKNFSRKINYNKSFIKYQEGLEKYQMVVSESIRKGAIFKFLCI